MIRKRKRLFGRESAGFEVAARSTVGMVRDNNEDSFGVFDGEPDDRLFIVADGMGGHERGEVASRTAIETIREVYFSDSSKDVATALTRAFAEANRRIKDLSDDYGVETQMGTTGTALAIRDGRLYIGHVGDSRMYRITDDEISQITEDHTLVNELVRDGILSPAEAESDPRRHSLLRGLGVEENVYTDVLELKGIESGDRILICSDGLNIVPEERIAEICRSSDPEAACEQLVRAADERGGPDNTTVVLVQYH